MGVTCWHAPWVASVEEVLRRLGEGLDVAYLHRYGVVQRYGALVRRWCPRARLLYCVADLHYLRESRRQAVQAGIPVDAALLPRKSTGCAPQSCWRFWAPTPPSPITRRRSARRRRPACRRRSAKRLGDGRIDREAELARAIAALVAFRLLIDVQRHHLHVGTMPLPFVRITDQKPVAYVLPCDK